MADYKHRQYYATGTKERESFDSVVDTLEASIKVGVIQVNFGSADSPVSISHSLKKTPKYFILTRSESAIIIYATKADRGKWTKEQIVLRSNTTGEVEIVCG